MPFIAILASYLLVSYYSVAEGKYISDYVDGVYQSRDMPAKEALSDGEAGDGEVASQKYSDCMNSFGNKIFCGCLRDKTPVEIDFKDYVKVLTTPKSGLGYDKADSNTRQVIDDTLKTAEVCINVAEQ
jgi:hypothetical protein